MMVTTIQPRTERLPIVMLQEQSHTFNPRFHRTSGATFAEVWTSLCQDPSHQMDLSGVIVESTELRTDLQRRNLESFAATTIPEWQRLVAFEDDWDGEGASAPTVRAIAVTALILVTSLAATFDSYTDWVDPVAILPTPDGGAYLEWANDEQSVQIVVSSTGYLRMLKLHSGTVYYMTGQDETESPWTAILEIELIIAPLH